MTDEEILNNLLEIIKKCRYRVGEHPYYLEIWRNCLRDIRKIEKGNKPTITTGGKIR